jgi:uncharacterized cupredoxin-like copper-binding protein
MTNRRMTNRTMTGHRRARMRRGARWGWILATMWIAASAATAAYALAAPGGSDADRHVLGPGEATVTLDVNHSRFVPARVTVFQHTTVTFKIVNHDPIGHEFIVGGDEVHAVHETGTHGQHGSVPGEVSVAPGETASTSYTFHAPGVVLYACHLPGHFAYGMVGEVVVKEAPV